MVYYWKNLKFDGAMFKEVPLLIYDVNRDIVTWCG